MAEANQLFRDDAFARTTVFVAGGSSGINLGIEQRFAGMGARVALVSRDQARIDAAARTITAAGARRRSVRHGG